MQHGKMLAVEGHIVFALAGHACSMAKRSQLKGTLLALAGHACSMAKLSQLKGTLLALAGHAAQAYSCECVHIP